MGMFSQLAQGVDWSSMGQMILRIAAVLLCLVIHEVSHGLAAYHLGDPTAKQSHRLSLNPLRHLAPLGLIMMIAVGFGWAKPVPVSTRNFKSPRKDELIVSLAGIIVNLILGVVFMIIWIVLICLPWSNEILNTMVQYCYTINFGLAVFNLLPIPPLDGYHVAQCLFMNAKTYKFFGFVEKYSYVILVAVLIINSRTHFLNTIVYWLMMPLMNLASLILSIF